MILFSGCTSALWGSSHLSFRGATVGIYLDTHEANFVHKCKCWNTPIPFCFLDSSLLIQQQRMLLSNDMDCLLFASFVIFGFKEVIVIIIGG